MFSQFASSTLLTNANTIVQLDIWSRPTDMTLKCTAYVVNTHITLSSQLFRIQTHKYSKNLTCKILIKSILNTP